MRTFHIRVNATIKRQSWSENDKPFFTEFEWSSELECDGIETLEKLLNLNNANQLKFMKIPSLIICHIDYDNDLEYDSINDEIIKIHTRLIREIG